MISTLQTTADSEAMHLLFIADGLRAESITAHAMPTVERLKAAGVEYSNATTIAPSLTRPVAASLATGQMPRRTGIVGNSIRLPDFGVIDTGRGDELLEALAGQAKAPITPGISDRLGNAGRLVATVTTGSSGCGVLLNPNRVGICVQAGPSDAGSLDAISPPEVAERIHATVGDLPANEARTSAARIRWVSHLVCDVLLPDYTPDVLIVWLNEPDDAQHKYGLVADEVSSSLREVDDCIKRITSAASGLGRRLSVIILADHGATQAHDRVDVEVSIAEAFPQIAENLTVCNNDGAALVWFHNAKAGPSLPDLANWFMDQPWSGPLFVKPGHKVPGTFSTAVIGCDHPSFGPDLIATMAAEVDIESGAQTAWYAAGPRAAVAGSHGTLAAGDLNIPLILHGHDFGVGKTVHTPASILDVNATLLWLTGILGRDLPGRVLWESVGANAGAPKVDYYHLTARRGTRDISRVECARVEGRRYVTSGYRLPF